MVQGEAGDGVRLFGKTVLQTIGCVVLESHGLRGIRVVQQVTLLIEQKQSARGWDGLHHALEDLMQVHLDHNQREDRAIPVRHRGDGAQGQGLRLTDLSMLPIRVDAGQPHLSLPQVLGLLDKILFTLVLQCVGFDPDQAPLSALDACHFRPTLADADQTQLKIFWPGVGQGAKELLESGVILRAFL